MSGMKIRFFFVFGGMVYVAKELTIASKSHRDRNL